MINLKTKNWTIENVDTILFDKDGTFIDLHYFWGKMTELRVSKIIELYNLPSSEYTSQLCLFLGYDIKTGKMLKDGITAMYSRPIIIQKFCKNLNEIGIEITGNELEKIFDGVNEVFYREMVNYTKPIDSSINFIKKVRSLGIKTGIVTSDSKESTLLTLKHFEWENLFDVIIGRESTKETKESGVPVKMALEILRANHENCLMIGDAPMDYISAQNGGVNNVILVATGQIDKETLSKICSCCVKTLEELICF